MNKEAIMAWGQEKMLHTVEVSLETGYRHYHGLRVANMCLRMAEELDLEVNKDVLYVGGYLHDVGKAGNRGSGHGPRGAEMIREEIPHLFEPVELELVLDMVSNHYMRPNSHHFAGKDKPQYRTEVLLVQDADTIDHFGGNGIWIAFRWDTENKRSQQESIDYFYSRDVQWQQDALKWLNFALSRRELEHRIRLQHEFFRNWQREQNGELYVR